MSEPRCTFLVRSGDSLPGDLRRCDRPASEHPVSGRGRFEDHQKPMFGGLSQRERQAIDYLLSRPYADPDEDGNVVARAALRLDLARSRFAWAQPEPTDLDPDQQQAAIDVAAFLLRRGGVIRSYTDGPWEATGEADL